LIRLFGKDRSKRGTKRRKTKESQGPTESTFPAKWTGLFVVILFAAGILLFVTADTSISFAEAQANPQLREGFVDQVIKEYPPPPEAALVVYATPEIIAELESKYGITRRPSVGMITHNLEPAFIEERGLREIKARTVIFPYMFTTSGVKSEHDFASSLRHDYRHVERFNQLEVSGFFYDGDFLMVEDGSVQQHSSESLAIIIDELEIRRAQGLEDITPKDSKVSQRYIDDHTNVHTDIYLELLAFSVENTPAHPETMEQMIIEFFEPWFLSRDELSFTPDGTPQFTNPETGRSYILPKEVLSK